MQNKVFFRVDGNAEIGLGHLVRCLALSHMLKEDFDCHFFSKKIPDAVVRTIIEQDFQFSKIKSEEDFLFQLRGKEIVVLDSYEFDSAYQQKIKEIGGKLVCIDDFHNQYFYADIVINHAPGVTESDYVGEPYTKYLLGPSFALLRPEFLEKGAQDKKNEFNGIKKIFICFGGSDFKNLSTNVLCSLPAKDYIVTIVIGNAYTHHDELKEAIEKRKDLKVIVKQSLSAKEILYEISNANVAIVPASGIALEAISVNIPLISGYYADNQFSLYKWLQTEELIFDSKDFAREPLIIAINNINNNSVAKQIRNQKNVIDLRSDDRIRDAFKKLHTQQELK